MVPQTNRTWRAWWSRTTRTLVWRLASWWPWRWLPWSQQRITSACRAFRREREYLEARFVNLGRIASMYGLPCWHNATFDDKVVFIQNRRTGELLALVVTLLEIDATRPFRPQDICFRELGGQVGDVSHSPLHSKDPEENPWLPKLDEHPAELIARGRYPAANELQPPSPVSDEDGESTETLSAGSDFSNGATDFSDFSNGAVSDESDELSHLSAWDASQKSHDSESFATRGEISWRFQDATAIFRFDGVKWCTEGHSILDCSPEDIVVRYRQSFRVL